MHKIIIPLFIIGLVILLPLTAQADEPVLTASRDLVLGATRHDTVSAGRNIALNGTSIMGSATAGRSINGVNCRIENALSAGRDVNLQNCVHLYSVSAGRSLNLVNSNVEENVSSGLGLALVNSTVKGDAFAVGGVAKLEGSKINGTLSTSGLSLTVSGSTVNNIILKQPVSNIAYNNGISLQNGVITYGNSVSMVAGRNDLIVNRGNGYTTVTLGPGSLSNLNGYTVRSTMEQTTLQTPDGVIYVNGKKVSGQGPNKYDDYRAEHMQAPFINAPGWPDVTSGSYSNEYKKSTQDSVLQSIELVNNSNVTGTITFGSGKGKVTVHPGSSFSGEVQGGKVEHL